MFNLTAHRLRKCSSYASVHSLPLCADVGLQDFVKITPSDNCSGDIGQIINIESIRDINSSELVGFNFAHWNSRLPTNHNMALVRIWEKVDARKDSYKTVDLHLQHTVLKDIDELVQTQKVLWICSGEILDVAYVFPMSDLVTNRFPSLNGVINVYFARYTENTEGIYEPVGELESFLVQSSFRYRLFSTLFCPSSQPSNRFFSGKARIKATRNTSI